MTDQSKGKNQVDHNLRDAEEADKIRRQRAEDEKRPPVKFISEGVRDEIERFGKALDPMTGRTLTREDLAKK